jgi:serine O-acetyltransferase
MRLADLLRTDVARYRELDGWRTVLAQGFWAGLEYRIGHWARHADSGAVGVLLRPITVVTHKLIQILTGIDISHGAHIGAGFHINHFGGIFINRDAVIGDNCGISHGVTIGNDDAGTPTIGDRVSIHACALVIGAITVGDGATIGAGSLVRSDVPANALAVGVPPARIIER